MTTETVMMPRSLTAENDAKTLMTGAFHETVTEECPCCEGDGWEDEESGEECYTCKGSGDVFIKVPVQWTTIKAIYAMAVKELGG